MTTLTKAEFGRIRHRLLDLHKALRSWQKVADATGLTKGEAHAIGARGHVPRNERVLAILTGRPLPDAVLQRRGRNGRFIRRNGG